MSPLSSPYERKDLPVAEKQKWTPVPPYIPRIQKERLCSGAVLAPPPSSSVFKDSSWFKVPFWNSKASLSSSSPSAVDKSESLDASPAQQPAAALVALGPIAPGPALKIAAGEGSVSGPPLQARGDGVVEVQQQVSRRGSILISQALLLKQSHYVLSWQVTFSGSQSPPLHSLITLFKTRTVYAHAFSISWRFVVLRYHGLQGQNEGFHGFKGQNHGVAAQQSIAGKRSFGAAAADSLRAAAFKKT